MNEFSQEDLDEFFKKISKNKYLAGNGLPIGLLDSNPTKGVISECLTGSMFRDGVYHIGGGILTGKKGFEEFDKALQRKVKEYVHDIEIELEYASTSNKSN